MAAGTGRPEMADALRPDLGHQPHPVPAVAIGRALRITRVAVGSEQTRLVVLRGNSGSGKSTVAKALRAACGQEMAWVSQDLTVQQTIGLIAADAQLPQPTPTIGAGP